MGFAGDGDADEAAAHSGAAIGGSVGVTVAVIAVGLLIFAVVSLRRRSRDDK